MFLINLLVVVGFYTLNERVILSLAAGRQAPGVRGVRGVLQPFADAIKLFGKDIPHLRGANTFIFTISPGFSLGLALAAWSVFPFWGTYSLESSGLLLLCFVSLSSMPIMAAGWASNSKYSMLAAIRSVAQAISFEVVMGLLLIFPLCFKRSLEMSSVSYPGQVIFLGLCFPMFMGMWFACILAETNRAPFDLAEAESELVSGYTVEYGGLHFALFFMAEYSNMLLFSVITTSLYLSDGILFSHPAIQELVFMVKAFLVSILILLSRAAFPRIRFDHVMMLMWKGFLPVALSGFLFILSFFTH
nr:NADH dehydrogenase subunit 1 [Glottidia pyramidata]